MKSSFRPILLAAATLVAASSAFAADGTWTLLNSGNASGTWSTAGNWAGSTIADGTDGIADFSTLNITTNSTVTLDGNRSIGTLIFSDATTASNNWSLISSTGPRTLTLSTTSGTPTINVVNGTATIGTQASGTNVILAGTQGFTKTGSGTLVIADGNAATYGGTTFISAGTLQVGAGGAFGRVGSASTLIDISDGATFNHVQGATVSQVIQGSGNVVSGFAGFSGINSTFTGLNTYTGSTTVVSTTLNVNTLANGGSNSAIGASSNAATNLVITNATLAYNGTTAASTDRMFQIGSNTAGDTGTISNNAAVATNTLTFSNTGAVTYGTTNQTRTVGLGGSNTGANVFAALIGNNGTGAVSLTKTGAGNWTLSNANTYTGGTTINGGTLALSGSGTLGATTSTLNFSGAGTLNVGSTNQTLANLTVANGITGTVNGAGGTLTLGGSAFQLGSTGAATQTLNMAGLSSFVFNNATPGTFSVGGNPATGTATASTTLTLASTNTITASALNIGKGTANTTTAANVTVANLGQNNTFNTTAIEVGTNSRSDATLRFQSGLSGTALTIRGVTGGSSRADMLVGSQLSASVNNTGTVDLVTGVTGGSTLDAMIGTLTVGQNARSTAAGSNNSNATGTFTMGGGILDATTIIIGQDTSGISSLASSTTNGTFTTGSGTVKVGTLTLGDKRSNQTAMTVNSAFNLNAGCTLQAGTIADGANAATTVTRNFNWNDGTIQNIAGSDLTIASTATGAQALTLKLASTGTHTFDIGAGRTGTVSARLVDATTGGTLAKAGAGVLTLSGANTYTGGTTISAGTLTAGHTSALGSGSVNVATAGATLQIGSTGVTLGTGANLAVVDGAIIKLGALVAGALDGAGSVITLQGGTFNFNGSGQLDLGGVLNNLTAGAHTYRLISGAAGSGNTDFLTGNITGYDATVSGLNYSNGLLTFTAVPEPSTYGLIGAGALAAAAMVRRRRKLAGKAA